MYTVIGEKSAYITFLMFLGMIKDTSKDKKWSIGANESAAGQGKAIQCVIHLVIILIYAAFPPITAYIRGYSLDSHVHRDVCIIQNCWSIP